VRSVVILGVLVALSSPAAAQPAEVDETRLAELLEERGFTPPDTLKALVGRIHLTSDGATSTTWYDYRGTSDDRDDWWPASSIKLYAAIAALERARAMGFTPDVGVTYHYDESAPFDGAEPFTARLRDIVRLAMVQSNNHAFNRLVELVGHDRINRQFFTEDNGRGTRRRATAPTATRRASPSWRAGAPASSRSERAPAPTSVRTWATAPPCVSSRRAFAA